jgi:O-antigen/teichoic acid export membrane protein
LYINGHELIRLWLGPGFETSVILMWILLAGRVAMYIQQPSNVLLIACGQHRVLAVLTLGEGLANVALSIYLAPTYGLIGVALGTTIPMLVSKILVQPRYVSRTLALGLFRYLALAFGRALVANIVFAAAYFSLVFLVGVAPATSLPSLLGGLLWQTLLFAAVAYCVGLDHASHSRLMHQLAGAPLMSGMVATWKTRKVS